MARSLTDPWGVSPWMRRQTMTPVREEPGADHQHHERDEHQCHMRARHASYPRNPSASRARRINSMPLPSSASSTVAVR
jgi:hypothetical protein